MRTTEYLAHDAALANALKLRPAERANLHAARGSRDRTREAWQQAGQAWADAENARGERANRNEAGARRREALQAAVEDARLDADAAARSLASIEWDIALNRHARRLAVEVPWQALVDERARQEQRPMIEQLTRVRTFESPEEREAAYAAYGGRLT